MDVSKIKPAPGYIKKVKKGIKASLGGMAWDKVLQKYEAGELDTMNSALVAAVIVWTKKY